MIRSLVYIGDHASCRFRDIGFGLRLWFGERRLVGGRVRLVVVSERLEVGMV